MLLAAMAYSGPSQLPSQFLLDVYRKLTCIESVELTRPFIRKKAKHTLKHTGLFLYPLKTSENAINRVKPSKRNFKNRKVISTQLH